MSDNSNPRRTLFKVLKWALAGLLAVLIVAVVAVELVSWNFLKDPIQERAEAATGRELQINGDVSVSLMPRPHLELENVALANADWAQEPEMLTARRLEVTPSLTDLVRGELVLDDLSITDPTLNLEGRDQEAGNWLLPTITSEESGGGPESSVSGNTEGTEGNEDPAGNPEGNKNTENTEGQDGPPIVIHDINLQNAEINYLAPGMEDPHVLSFSSVHISDDRVTLQAEADLSVGGERLVVAIRLSGNASLGYADGRWRLDDLDAQVGDTRISGNIGLDTSTEPPAMTGNLHSPSINVTDIMASLPQSPESPGDQSLSIPELPNLTGDLRLSADEVIWEPVTATRLEAHVTAGEHTLALETLSFGMAEGKVEATAGLTSSAEVITAETHIQLQELVLQDGHVLDGELALNLDQVEQASSLDRRTLLNQLSVGVAEASYRSIEDDTDLDLTLDESGDPPVPVLSTTGRFQGKALDLTIEGAPLASLAQGLANYPLQARAQSGQLSARADTRLGAILTPETFTGNLVLEGNRGQDLDRWVGAALPPLPGFHLAGQLSRDQDQWSATSVEGTIGTAEVAGDVHFRNADQPVINVDLDVGTVELAQFARNDESGSDGEDSSASNGEYESESPLAALNTFNGTMDLRADTLVLPNDLALEGVYLTGQLEGGNLGIETLAFEVANGTWDSTLNLDASGPPASGTIDATFNSIALSQIGDTFTAVEDRLGTLSGELHLEITETRAADWQEDLLLPYVGQLTLEPSWLQFIDDEAGTDMTLELTTRDSDSGDQGFHIDGSGQYDGSPFSLRFRGDPLLDARVPDRPYSIDLSSDVVDSHIRVRGTVMRPLALEGLDLGLELEGPDPQRLSRLLGIPLPDLPPYSVSGNIQLDDQRWRFTNLAGDVGDSDLNGHITFDAGSRPTHLSGELNSSSLDIEDLGGLVGAEPEPADPTDQESETDVSGDQSVLPDQPLATPAWQDIAADVRYRGDSVRAAGIPLSNVVIDFELENGKARFDPVSFGIGDGRVDFNLDLDSKRDPPEGTLQLEVQGVNLKEALRNWSMANESVGTVGAQGKFWVTGTSIAELLASADGGLVLLMSEGELDALLVELAGLDASQAFLSWLRARDPIPIDCTYIDLQARDGVATIDTLAVDTADTSFTGTGTVDLNSEQLDVTIYAHPKDPSVLSGRTPFHIGGTFSDIDPGVHGEGLALRAGGSAVLAAVAGPVAALLPLLDLGTGDDIPYCEGLATRSLEAIDD